MYATVRSYSGSQQLGDELVKREDEVKSLVSGISGFRAYYLLKTSEGDVTSVTVYDDQAGAEESNQVAANWIKENLSDMSVSPPEVSAGEVVIDA